MSICDKCDNSSLLRSHKIDYVLQLKYELDLKWK